MNTRPLGKTGIKVSEIAFGGVEIGIPYGIGVNGKEDMLSRKDAVELLHKSIEAGVNFFDTARLYGESESIMGDAFHDRRDKVIISTKCKHFRVDGKIPGYNELKKIIDSSIEESLRNLKTDYVDGFMLHQGDLEILHNNDVKMVFESLKASGKTRSIGASTYSAEETRMAIDKGWDVVQLPFNMMDQRQAENFSYAAEKGTGIVVRSVLMKGLLSDKGRDLHPALSQVENHIKKFRDLLAGDIKEISTLATKFALSFKEISSVLVGIDRTEYLYKAVNALSGNLLDATALNAAKALAYPDPEFLDLPKWDRLGWLK